MRVKMAGWYIGISIVLFVSVTTITFYSLQQKTYLPQVSYADQLICPTPDAGSKTLQVKSCYVITSTPIPGQNATPPPGQNPTPGPTGKPAQCNISQPTDYNSAKAALSRLKINLVGTTNTGWAIETFNSVCLLSKSSQYFSRLTARGTITVNLHAGGCSGGFASASNGLDMYGFCDKRYNRYLLGHELGHMFAFRNPSVYNQYVNTVWPVSIPTWNCTIHWRDGPTPPECFADLVGEYLSWSFLRGQVGPIPGGEQPFKSYPTGYYNTRTHINYYGFGKNTIFGGIEYTSF
jgi:hypothetical protein